MNISSSNSRRSRASQSTNSFFSSSRSRVTSSTSSGPIQKESITIISTIQTPLPHRSMMILDEEIDAAMRWLNQSDLLPEDEAEAYNSLARAYNAHQRFFEAENTSLQGLTAECSDYMKYRLYHTLLQAYLGQGLEDEAEEVISIMNHLNELELVSSEDSSESEEYFIPNELANQCTSYGKNRL